MIGLQDTISINKNLTMNVMTIDLNVNGVLMDDQVVCTKNGRLGKWDTSFRREWVSDMWEEALESIIQDANKERRRAINVLDDEAC